MKILFAAFLLAAFCFRLAFGLCSEFWFDDEKQIYLLGLKYFATGAWPFFGPDVVYTNSQIPGALQALLVGIPLKILPLPESPFILLNLLSLGALALLAWYCRRRLPQLPAWFVWPWLLFAPWTMNFSTHVVNPSYVLSGAVVFWIGFFEAFTLTAKGIVPRIVAFFLMGLGVAWIMQLHMSWVLCIPFVMAAGCALLGEKSRWKRIASSFGMFAAGFAVIGFLLFPTFLVYGWSSGSGGAGANVVFSLHNLRYVFDVLARFLSFSAFEIPRFIGIGNDDRMAFLLRNLWAAPCIVFVALTGIIQPLYMILRFFLRHEKGREWHAVRYCTLGAFVLTTASFLLSIKGPSSHTFYLLFPVAMLYAFYCLGPLFALRWFKILIAAVMASGLVFHLSLGIDNYSRKSMYKDRRKVVNAIAKKDYTLLGKRRADEWGRRY